MTAWAILLLLVSVMNIALAWLNWRNARLNWRNAEQIAALENGNDLPRRV